jgi:hypothetical protein
MKINEMKVQNGQSPSALVNNQRPNFTIAFCSASANFEKCSFGHFLVTSNFPFIKSLKVLGCATK